MGRVDCPSEVASAYLILASEDASYITGHQLNVDGSYQVIESVYYISLIYIIDL
jgi:NAD(P)-dependent dehydrogenase (short-subunit alcohol dehydrogenase family)